VTPLIQTTTADFSSGARSGTYLSSRAGGEITLTPNGYEEFSGTVVPTGWSSTAVDTGGSVGVASGAATVSGRLLRSPAGYGPGRQLDVVATLRATNGQWLGATNGEFGGLTDSWVVFRTTSAGGLVAETDNGILGTTTTALPASLLGSAHRFSIDWTATGTTFAVDGATVATHTRAALATMKLAFRDSIVDSNPLSVDSVWLTPYAASGTFTSGVVDAGANADWRVLTPTATIPTGTTVKYEVRTGPVAAAGGTGWSAWSTVAAGADMPGIQRYLQYRATLTTGSTRNAAPTLSAVQLAYAIP
jgi:hypothetical protein